MTSPEIPDAAAALAQSKLFDLTGVLHDYRCVSAALTAALPHLAAGRAEAVAVKPLVWRPEKNGQCSAETVVGSYWVFTHAWWRLPGLEVHTCDTFEAAKAAAQQDFEQRIRSALVSAPAAPSEATVEPAFFGFNMPPAAPSASQEALREALRPFIDKAFELSGYDDEFYASVQLRHVRRLAALAQSAPVKAGG